MHMSSGHVHWYHRRVIVVQGSDSDVGLRLLVRFEKSLLDRGSATGINTVFRKLDYHRIIGRDRRFVFDNTRGLYQRLVNWIQHTFCTCRVL